MVYICPDGSTRDNDFRRQLMELEVDIVEFRKKGLVVCMGDFNSRIGSINSVLTYGERCVVIERTSEDNKIDGSALERGHQFVDSMNACNMVILNGVDNMAEYTFEVRNRKSTVDLLIVDDRIFQQGDYRGNGDSDERS